MILYLLNLIKGSTQQELDHFFQVINQMDCLERGISKSAFTQARKKLLPSAFRELNALVVQHFYAHAKTQQWNGFRLCAVDGSQCRLPEAPQIREAFGVHKGRHSQDGCPMALISAYYDVLNKVVIDCSLSPTGSSERECAFRHLEAAAPNDLILFDRGYPAFWLFAALRHKHLTFCMRTKTGLEKVYRDFKKSGKREAFVEMKPNKRSMGQCAENGLSEKPLRLRLVRVDLPTETEVLVTNLLDQQRYPAECFKHLYHLRWGVEENYKRKKQWLEIENFSGKSALSVQQDFFAKIVTLNLTAIMVAAGRPIADEKTASRRYPYQINFAQALSMMKDTVVLLIRNAHFGDRIPKLLRYLALSVEPIRAYRNFKRNIKSHKTPKFNGGCYKRCA